jgi:hypothetical protein
MFSEGGELQPRGPAGERRPHVAGLDRQAGGGLQDLLLRGTAARALHRVPPGPVPDVLQALSGLLEPPLHLRIYPDQRAPVVPFVSACVRGGFPPGRSWRPPAGASSIQRISFVGSRSAGRFEASWGIWPAFSKRRFLAPRVM